MSSEPDDDFQRILRILECPICKKTMSSPISMCNTGHHICSSCRFMGGECYVCRADITKMRNDFAERVSESIRNMCRYSQYGCRERVNHDQRSQHEDDCTFLPVECLAGIGEGVVKCGWRGGKINLLQHITLAHGSSLVNLRQMIKNIEIRGFDRNFVEVTLWCVAGELFWVTVKQDICNNTRLEIVQYIGPKGKATEFKYQLELTSLDGETTLSFASATENCFEDMNAIFASKSCFIIDLDFLKQSFMSLGNRVPGYKLTVQKISHTPIANSVLTPHYSFY